MHTALSTLIIMIMTIICLINTKNKDDCLRIVIEGIVILFLHQLYLIIHQLYYHINYGNRRHGIQNKYETSVNSITIGLEKRTLIPTRITLRHAFMSWTVKLNYIIHFFVCSSRTIALHLKLIQQPIANDKAVCEFILNTSAGLYTKFTQLSENLELMEFSLDNFAFIEMINKYDNKLRISAEIEVHKESIGENKHYKIIVFEFNGVQIKDSNEQLTLIITVYAVVFHPMIHSFFDQLYNYGYTEHASPSHNRQILESVYDDLLLHGQYVNHVSWNFSGWLYGGSTKWMSILLEYNGCRIILPKHMKAVKILAEKSLAMNFMYRARKILFELIYKYQVPIDGELLFLSSIVHAVEHNEVWKSSSGYYQLLPTIAKEFHIPTLNSAWLNFVAHFLYGSSQYMFRNLLKDKREQNLFYGELYQLLHQINPYYADQVTLSISF
ncbi:unnamed protein product [Adineta steineri]|uniref:Uncharacterized protein n=2 Tax=Adineta steineri TaxID=433720 RepID=A0A814R140_9BILA|nr:unnamed protein product [Adineta steineri]